MTEVQTFLASVNTLFWVVVLFVPGAHETGIETRVASEEPGFEYHLNLRDVYRAYATNRKIRNLASSLGSNFARRIYSLRPRTGWIPFVSANK